jgi:hypothetical protein
MPSILARIGADSSPAVFIADSLKDGQLQMWDGAAGTKTVGVDYYMRTQPVSDADAEALRKRYAKATGQPLESVFLRQRLPRTYKERPNLIAGQQENKRAAAARAQMEADILKAGNGTPQPEAPTSTPSSGATVPVTVHVAPEYAQALKMMEDPRTAALILKIAETLRVAL